MKLVFMGLFAVLLLLSAVNLASAAVYNSLNYPELRFSDLRYDPAPAVPGSVVNLWFTVQNKGSQPTQNASFQLELSYPFYLDSGETALKSGWVIPSNETALVNYKVRVREDAASGDYNLTLNYCGYGNYGNCASREVVLRVSDAKTNFDVAVQDISQGQVSIAVSNIGKNSANAVTVKTQGQREAASIIGSLAAGDYTVISIPLAVAYGEKLPQQPEQRNISITITYTDSAGNRQTVSKLLTLDPLATASGLSAFAVVQPKGSGLEPWLATFVIFVIGGLLYLGYTKFYVGKPEKPEPQ